MLLKDKTHLPLGVEFWTGLDWAELGYRFVDKYDAGYP
jgi:hypothetical protein